MKGLREGRGKAAGGSCPQGSQAAGGDSESAEVLTFQRALWPGRVHPCHQAQAPRWEIQSSHGWVSHRATRFYDHAVCPECPYQVLPREEDPSSCSHPNFYLQALLTLLP